MIGTVLRSEMSVKPVYSSSGLEKRSITGYAYLGSRDADHDVIGLQN